MLEKMTIFRYKRVAFDTDSMLRTENCWSDRENYGQHAPGLRFLIRDQKLSATFAGLGRWGNAPAKTDEHFFSFRDLKNDFFVNTDRGWTNDRLWQAAQPTQCSLFTAFLCVE